jgi:hypothetical protein
LARRGAAVVINDLGGDAGRVRRQHRRSVVDEITQAGAARLPSYPSVDSSEPGDIRYRR